MKDHEIREAINELRDIAKEFHAAQQLRDRICHVILPLVKNIREEKPNPHRKIVDYHCVYAADSQMLGVRTGQWIMKGWQPFGGVSASTSISEGDEIAQLVYAQALVRYEECSDGNLGHSEDMAVNEASGQDG